MIKMLLLSFVSVLALASGAHAESITLDTTGSQQIFGVGGTAVGTWNTNMFTVNTPLTSSSLTTNTLAASGVASFGNNINLAGSLNITGANEPFSNQSANTVSNLKNLAACASGQSLTKTGPNTFQCIDSSSSAASVDVTGGGNSGSMITVLGQGTFNMHDSIHSSVHCKRITFTPWSGQFTALGNVYYLHGQYKAWTGWSVFFEDMNMSAGTGQACIDSSGNYTGAAVSENFSYVIYGVNTGSVPAAPASSYQNCNNCYLVHPSSP